MNENNNEVAAISMKIKCQTFGLFPQSLSTVLQFLPPMAKFPLNRFLQNCCFVKRGAESFCFIEKWPVFKQIP